MNRQTKRQMAKQQGKEKPSAPKKPNPSAPKKQRTSAAQFLREVRLELKKVQWPTRKELVAYTVVVLVAVTVLTSFVFVLDYLFSKAVLNLFGS